MAWIVFWVAILFTVGMGVFTFFSNQKRIIDPTLKQIADTIDEFLDGKGGPYDWHDFVTHHSYKDPYLESIRKECAAIARKYPPEEKKNWCSEQGKNELLRISERIRDEFKKTVEARKKAYADAKAKQPQATRQPAVGKGTLPGKGPFGKGPIGKGLLGKGTSGKGPKTAVTQMLNAPMINTAAPVPNASPVVPVVKAPVVNIPQPGIPAPAVTPGTAVPVLNPVPVQNVPVPVNTAPPPIATGTPPPVLNLPKVGPPAIGAPATIPVAPPSVNIPAPVPMPPVANSPTSNPPAA